MILATNIWHRPGEHDRLAQTFLFHAEYGGNGKIYVMGGSDQRHAKPHLRHSH